MLEITETHGSWWVPNDPAVRPSGRITFKSTDGGSIVLWGPRLGVPLGTEAFTAADRAPWFFDRIFGSTERGYVTALGCRVLRTSYNLGSTDTKQVLECLAIIMHVHASPDLLFREARAQIINFDDWTTFGTVRPDGRGGHSVVMEPGFEVNLGDGAKLHLHSSLSSSQGFQSARVEINNQLGIAFQEPIKYEDVIPEWINPFVDLITLATGRPSGIEKLELSDQESEPGQVWYEVGLRLGYDPSKRKAPIWAHEPVLTFSDLDAVRRIPLWYEMSYKLKGIFNYAFGARYSTDISPENRYLNATTAAEAIHRELVLSRRKKVDLGDSNLRAFVESFPEHERKLLQDRFAHLNDESFHERLRHLYDATRPVSEKIAPNGEKWIATVKKTRNALTHQSGRLHSKVASGDKLNALAESVFLMIVAFILVHLDYSPEAIDGWLDRQRRARTITDPLHAYFPEFVDKSNLDSFESE